MTPDEEKKLITMVKYNSYMLKALLEDYCSVVSIIMEDKKENIEKRISDAAEVLFNKNIAGKN